jgi:hypothetical protein
LFIIVAAETMDLDGRAGQLSFFTHAAGEKRAACHRVYHS